MAQAAIAIVGSVLSGALTQGALTAQAEAREEEANLRLRELERQSREDARDTQEEKSQRVLEADRQIGRTIAVFSDIPGASGSQNQARVIGEIGAMEGLDIATLESNKKRRTKQRVAEGRSIRRQLFLDFKQTQLKQIANTVNVATGAAKGIFGGGESGAGAPSGIGTGGPTGSSFTGPGLAPGGTFTSTGFAL